MRKTRKRHKNNTLRNLHKVHTTENYLPRQIVLVQGVLQGVLQARFRGKKRTPASGLQGGAIPIALLLIQLPNHHLAKFQ